MLAVGTMDVIPVLVLMSLWRMTAARAMDMLGGWGHGRFCGSHGCCSVAFDQR